MVWYLYLACCIIVSSLFLFVKRFKPGCSLSLVAFLIAAFLLFIGERCIGYNPSWYIVASGMVALAVLVGGGRKMQKENMQLLPGCLISIILLTIFFLLGYYIYEKGIEMIEGEFTIIRDGA